MMVVQLEANLMKHSSMTPSQQAKAAGLKSLTQVSQITGVSLNTLTNWHRDKQLLFKIVLLGCRFSLKVQEVEER